MRAHKSLSNKLMVYLKSVHMKEHGHGEGLSQSIKIELSVICVHLLAFAYIIAFL